MFKQLLQQITNTLEPGSASQGLMQHDIERICAVLLVEIARSDHDVSDVERTAIVNALTQSSSLELTELEALVDEAFLDADNTLSLHEHVRLINETFAKEDKIALLEHMWRVAYADGNVDGYEEYTIRKLSDLLFMKHRDFMQAKLKVAEAH